MKNFVFNVLFWCVFLIMNVYTGVHAYNTEDNYGLFLSIILFILAVLGLLGCISRFEESNK